MPKNKTASWFSHSGLERAVPTGALDRHLMRRQSLWPLPWGRLIECLMCVRIFRKRQNDTHTAECYCVLPRCETFLGSHGPVEPEVLKSYP